MQLKMPKSTFNLNKVKQILVTENDFITNLFSKIDLPNQVRDDDIGVSADSENLKRKFKNSSTKKGQNAARAKSLEELQARLQTLKDKKKFSYKERLSKKALKTHIRKKLRKDERTKLIKPVTVPKVGESLNTEENVESEKSVKPPKPVFNSQGKMVFSKFDFSDINDRKNKRKLETDPQKLLEQLNKNKEKINSLNAEGNTTKAEEIKEKMAWKAALAKAEGHKVKDDEELLKKSVKKREQIKRGSAKKWKSRIEGVKKAKDERQKKREENLNKRKHDKKNKKTKIAVKRGRVIPGF